MAKALNIDFGDEPLPSRDMLEQKLLAGAGPVRDIRIDEIIPDPENSRKKYDSKRISELAVELNEIGQLSPILVTPLSQPHPSGAKYMLVFGHRRYYASIEAGRKFIEGKIKEIDEVTRARLQWAENASQEQLTPTDKARSLARWKKAHEEALGETLTDKEFAEFAKLNASDVSRLMSIHNAPEYIKKRIEEGDLSAWSTAANIVKLAKKHPEALKKELSEHKGEIQNGDYERFRKKLEPKTQKTEETDKPKKNAEKKSSPKVGKATLYAKVCIDGKVGYIDISDEVTDHVMVKLAENGQVEKKGLGFDCQFLGFETQHM